MEFLFGILLFLIPTIVLYLYIRMACRHATENEFTDLKNSLIRLSIQLNELKESQERMQGVIDVYIYKKEHADKSK